MFKKLVFPLLCLLGLATPLCAEPRVYCAAARTFVSVDTALATLSEQDVVFVGEIHDSAACHQFELTLLQGLFERRPDLTLGLEMFERDVQPVLDGYLAGSVSDGSLAAEARLWPNYQTDYRPLVDFARTNHLEVLATNVPRSLASVVAHQGLAALQSVPVHVRRLYARHVSAPEDRYFELFSTSLGSSNHGGVDEGLTLRLFYQAQCLKDETMAETLADYREQLSPRHPLILHINGTFHTDYGLGTASRFRSRDPEAHVVVISVVAVDHPDQLTDGSQYSAQGDFILFIPTEPKIQSNKPEPVIESH